jgi:hypothetical protein
MRAVPEVVDAQHNFILEAQQASYYPEIVWSKSDAMSFLARIDRADNATSIGYLPDDDEAYPLEVKVVLVQEGGGATHAYYGSNCALYVMNEKGATLDKVRKDQLHVRERREATPIADPWDDEERWGTKMEAGDDGNVFPLDNEPGEENRPS